MLKTSTRLPYGVLANLTKSILGNGFTHHITAKTPQVRLYAIAGNGDLGKLQLLNGQRHVCYDCTRSHSANQNQWRNLLLQMKTVLPGDSRPQQHRFYASAAKGDTKNLDDFSEQERVYYGSLTPRMRAVKIFSLTTSLAGLAAQPVLMEQGMKMGGTGMAVLLCSFAGFFTFVTPFLLHFITKKYVTEIHYNPKTEEYTATTISIILQKLHTKFKPSDVKVPEVPGMFTSFVVKNKPLFVDPALFENPEHYVRIMGYDKPVDFKLDLKPDGSKKTLN